MKAQIVTLYHRKIKEMKTQDAITEALTIEPMPATKLAVQLGCSIGYIRTQLKAMETANLIGRVDDRLPVFYKVIEKDEDRDAINRAKKKLLAPPDPNDKNSFAEIIKLVPNKTDWPQAIPILRAYAKAIEELEEDGKLIDTL